MLENRLKILIKKTTVQYQCPTSILQKQILWQPYSSCYDKRQQSKNPFIQNFHIDVHYHLSSC